MAAAAVVCDVGLEDYELARRSHRRKWDKMSRRGVDSFIQSRPNDFYRRVHRGIPQEHRWTVWKTRLLAANSVSNARDAKEREKALLSGPGAASCVAGLLSRESTWGKLIKEDAPRTFPSNASFTEEYQQSFCRVLNAYAFLNPEVGYVQGMGYIVGLLLLTSARAEQDTLFVFARLMEDCGLNGLFQEGFPLLQQYMGTFDVLMDDLMPELRRHFEHEGVQSSDYAQQWFLSLFVYCLPMQTVLQIWDIVMCNGLPHLVLAAIALLSSVKEVLLAKKQEEIMDFFKSMKVGEEDIASLEVGRCIAMKIERLSKMARVQRILGIGAPGALAASPETTRQDENLRTFNLDNKKNGILGVSGSKKGRRVSFSKGLDTIVDVNVDAGGSGIAWYQW